MTILSDQLLKIPICQITVSVKRWKNRKIMLLEIINRSWTKTKRLFDSREGVLQGPAQ